MWLDDLIAPSGPLPASVYWVRRSALVLAIIIFFTVVLSIGGGHKKHPTTTGSTRPTSSVSPHPRSSTPTTSSSTTLTACDPTNLAISANADGSGTYPGGQEPHLTLAIKNNGPACKLDTAQRYLTISSGNDLWFSSKACATGASPVLNIGQGQTVTSQYTWNRKRQAKDCTIGASAAAGTFVAQAHYATLTSTGEVLHLS